jgi:Gly-Xaa carboxypeptidase
MSIIEKIGMTYGLSISGDGFEGASSSLGKITLTVDQPGAPSPITPTDSVAFEVFARAVQAAFGTDVVTAPSSMTGNTDTRHYVSLDRMIPKRTKLICYCHLR